jgi:hypothetical protein
MWRVLPTNDCSTTNPAYYRAMGNAYGNFRAEMEQEDELLRSAVKQAAYEYDSHGDPERFNRHLQELCEGSKARMRVLFEKYWVKDEIRNPAAHESSTNNRLLFT